MILQESDNESLRFADQRLVEERYMYVRYVLKRRSVKNRLGVSLSWPTPAGSTKPAACSQACIL